MWRNWNDAGERDLRTIHGVTKVTCPNTEKIALDAWFRAEKLPRAPRKSRQHRRAKAVATKPRARRRSR
eukprot:2125672-Pyramimonas_sp.AAC.1